MKDEYRKNHSVMRAANTFDFVCENFLDGMWYKSADNPAEEEFSDNFWRLLGYNPEAQNTLSWRQVVHPEDSEKVVENDKRHLHSTKPLVVFEMNVRYIDSHGTVLWMKRRGKAIEKNGEIIGMSGTFTNITKEKDREEILMKTTRFARVGAWQYYPESEDLHWDAVTHEIHEVAHDFVPSVSTGVNFYKEGESRDTILAALEKALTIGEPFDVELQLITAKGNELWVRAIGKLEKKPGKPTVLFGIFYDIDRMVKAEEDNHKLSVLKGKSKALEQFAYIASHDLREPLRTIMSFSDLLLNEYLTDKDSEIREIGSYINKAAEHMDSLVKGLLDFSLLNKRSKPDIVDMNEILEKVELNLAKSITETHTQIIYDYLPSVKGHPIEIVRLFQNLIVNAIKFKKADTNPVIEVEAKKIPRGWAFCVRDNGIGIEEKYQEAIFNLFKRLHHKDAYEGTGIGLAVCKRIVEMHNGSISVNSVPGEFTEFHFTFLTE